MVHNRSPCKKTWHLHLPSLACTEEMTSWWRVQWFCSHSFANLWPQLKRKFCISVTQTEFANFSLHFVVFYERAGNVTPRDCTNHCLLMLPLVVPPGVFYHQGTANTPITSILAPKSKENWKLWGLYNTNLRLICKKGRRLQKCCQTQFLGSYLSLDFVSIVCFMGGKVFWSDVEIQVEREGKKTKCCS